MFLDKNLTFVNESFDEPASDNAAQNGNVTTIFGRDDPITIINEDAISTPPPSYDGGTSFQAYRGQANKRNRSVLV